MPWSRAVNRAGTRMDRQRGAVAVEMAMSLLVLMPLLFGVLQYGYFFFVSQSASSAARETARRLVVGDCQTGTNAQTFARRQANVTSLDLQFGEPGADATDVTAAGNLPEPGEVLRVVVRADGGIIGYLPLPNGGNVVRVVDSLVEDDEEGAPCS